jgi:hypothetical protein
MASPSEIRKLYKAFSDDPTFHAAVRDAASPTEKHEIIRKAGHTPVTQAELQAELGKSLQPAATGGAVAPADSEFVGHVLQLAAAESTVNVS